MKIEDGKGKNGDAAVDAAQRLTVASSTTDASAVVSHESGLAYVMVYEFTAAAGDIVSYLKNTSSDKEIEIDDIELGGLQAIKWKVFTCTGTAAAGEAVTAVSLNLSKDIPAEATAMAGDTTITGLTAVGAIGSIRSAAGTTVIEDFKGALILGPGNAILIEYDTGTGGIAEAEIHFHYHDID